MKKNSIFDRTEKEIIMYLFKGFNINQIALAMSYSVDSIKKKKRKIFKKLECYDKCSFILEYYKIMGFDNIRKWIISKLEMDTQK